MNRGYLMKHVTTESPFRVYLTSIERELQQGIASEHTHRPALKAFIEAVTGTLATNEPKRIKCGAPDFIVTKEQIPLGYVEAKDIGIPLAQIEKDSEKAKPTTREGDQLKRYRESLSNLLFTDYLEFRWFLKGKLELVGCLATLKGKKKLVPDPEGTEQVKRILESFVQATAPTVTSPRELAARMAGIARLIRITIEQVFDDTEESPGSLQGQLDGFKQVLLPDLTPKAFADMYAQTICYGLFAARCNHTSGTFTRRDAVYDIPKTNPFLRKMFNHIAGIELDERINWAVDNLAELLNRADIDAILKDFGKHTRREDPIVHFYETFLAEYDPAMREKRGVYYTPEPVVSYIVHSVDHLLKTTFHLPDGLADTSKIQSKTADGKTVSETHRVQILDPATGTGTFLHSVIDIIHESFAGNQGMWSSYVSRHLLPRIFGLELLMAPYAVAHMKLGLQLKDSGYDFKSNERLRVYLTNTLEESYEHGRLPFVEWLVEEATAAGQAKHDVPVMVVLGNPPYSGHSANTGTWIHELLRGKDTQTGKMTANYFEVDGKPLGEKNPKWLNDDYVNFAQWRIEQTGYGILAFISNNGYLDNPTFRGMRQALLQTFDDIYVLDLHGNSKKKERSPDGSPDQNVFDIQQGVAIGIFVKYLESKERYGTIHHAHLWGGREVKYHSLLNSNVSITSWATLAPQQPHYLFIPQDIRLREEYEQGWQIQKCMPESSLGCLTKRDNLVIGFTKSEVHDRIAQFIDPNKSDLDATLEFELQLEDKDMWNARKARISVKREQIDTYIRSESFRPFDYKYIFYHDKFVARLNRRIMQHLDHGKNLGFVTVRQLASLPFDHAWVTNSLTDQHIISVRTKEGGVVFPLYLYPETSKAQLFTMDEPTDAPGGRRPNFAHLFINDLASKLEMDFIPDGKGNLQKQFGPEDIFNYMYAIFHSPTYRSRYADFLKMDFPHLPLTSQPDLFCHLCSLGSDLVSVHLMEKKCSKIPQFNIDGSDTIEIVRYTEPGQGAVQGRVWINNEQYFEGVSPDVWNFHIGGYQVCQKWLKDRKGRILEFEDMNHYQQIVAALAETIRIMDEIDTTISEYGGWPLS